VYESAVRPIDPLSKALAVADSILLGGFRLVA